MHISRRFSDGWIGFWMGMGPESSMVRHTAWRGLIYPHIVYETGHKRLSIWLWLNPLEFHHLEFIMSTVCIGWVQICAHEIVVSPFASALNTETVLNDTTTISTIPCNYTCRRFHTRASLTHITALLNVFISLSLSLVAVFYFHFASFTPVKYAAFMRSVHHEPSRCFVCAYFGVSNFSLHKICMHAQLSNRL